MALYILITKIFDFGLQMTRSSGCIFWFITPEGKEISAEIELIHKKAYLKFE